MPTPKVTPKTSSKPEEGWRRARLIPTTGIGGQEEQEQRATSSLSRGRWEPCRQFGRADSRPRRRSGRPDPNVYRDPVRRRQIRSFPSRIGAVVVERGKARLGLPHRGQDRLAPSSALEQVERYLELARVKRLRRRPNDLQSDHRARLAESPIAIDPRKAEEGRAYAHLSWWRVMTEARVEHKHRGIGDPDQSLDPRRADRISRPRAGRCRRLRRYGRSLGPSSRRRSRVDPQGVRIRASGSLPRVGSNSSSISRSGLTQDLGRAGRATLADGSWIRVGRRDQHVRSMVDNGKLLSVDSGAQMRRERSTSRPICGADGSGPRLSLNGPEGRTSQSRGSTGCFAKSRAAKDDLPDRGAIPHSRRSRHLARLRTREPSLTDSCTRQTRRREPDGVSADHVEGPWHEARPAGGFLRPRVEAADVRLLSLDRSRISALGRLSAPKLPRDCRAPRSRGFRHEPPTVLHERQIANSARRSNPAAEPGSASMIRTHLDRRRLDASVPARVASRRLIDC